MAEDLLNIVVLGGSFAGLSVSHRFLDQTIKQLHTFEGAPNYRVVIVSPSTHLYWNIAAPRAIVSSGLIPHVNTFLPTQPAFDRHPADKYVFIQGRATGIDFNTRNVTVAVVTPPVSKRSSVTSNQRPASFPSKRESLLSNASHSSTEIIPYHALIIATGSSHNSPLLSLHGPHEHTIEALDAFHKRIKDASSILVAGGGPSGVEIAGQIGTYFNTTSLWDDLDCMPRALGTTKFTDEMLPQRKAKYITLLSGGDRLLPRLRPSIARSAERKLKSLGVTVIHDVRLISAAQLPDGTYEAVLNNDTTMTTDLFVEATGVQPNTLFLPAELLDTAGYILADSSTLRIYEAGERVYALGDCCAYSKNYIIDVYDSVPPLMHNLLNDLLSYEYHYTPPSPLNNPFLSEAEAHTGKLVDKVFYQNPTDTLMMPITRFGGVGVIFSIWIPSFLIHYWKGRDYRVGKAEKVVRRGRNPYAYGLEL